MRSVPIITLLLAGLLAFGCSAKRIPGIAIDLEDNPDNRALLHVLDSYRAAFEHKDVDALVGMASERFYEDLGTPETTDDYDFAGLKTHFVKHFKQLKTIQLTVSLKNVKVADDKAQIDYRYVTRYLMDLPAGERWKVTDEINRIELVREDKTWKVLNGF
jgi:hypothetical protein